MTKKLVLKVGVHDEKSKQKAMKAVSSLKGVESLSVDMKEKKLTVIGDVDPVKVVGKLKNWHTELVSVGPAKEPEKKKEDEKKVEVKKPAEAAKPAAAEGDNKKKESEQIDELLNLYKKHYPQYTQYYNVHSIEENPNSCVIC